MGHHGGVGQSNFCLLTSYLGRRLKKEAKKPVNAFPTSYLDGLRRRFSIVVLIRHYLLPLEENLDRGYAQIGDEEGGIQQPESSQAPRGSASLLRSNSGGLVHSVWLCVSYKPLKLIWNGAHDALIQARISSCLPPRHATILTSHGGNFCCCYSGASWTIQLSL